MACLQAKAADVVVLCLGTTSQNDEGPEVDSEGHDEGDYSLPGATEKRLFCDATLFIEHEDLPRQARDKHRKS